MFPYKKLHIYALYKGCLCPAAIPEPMFLEFRYLAAEGMEFNFVNVMYA